MKKIAAFCFLFSIAVTAFADQCPNPNEVVTCKGGECVVNHPSGWWVAEVGNLSGPVNFSVAAWGDHSSTVDNVRCYYYNRDQSQAVKLVSEQRYPESSVDHSPWGNLDLYHLCSSQSVSDCKFG